MKTKRAGTRFVAHSTVLVNYVKAVGPTRIGSLGDVVKRVDNRWELDSKLRDAELAHLAALVEVLWTRKHDLVGIAWVTFALAVAVHVTDEARHDFLSTYNSSVRAIRARLPFLPLPTFSFRVWLVLLTAGIAMLLCLSPLAFRGKHWLRIVSRPLGIVVGVLNATLRISSSIYFHRWMPGVYSSPLLLIAASYLLATSWLRDSTAEA
jgi:hypothetical protein